MRDLWCGSHARPAPWPLSGSVGAHGATSSRFKTSCGLGGGEGSTLEVAKGVVEPSLNFAFLDPQASMTNGDFVGGLQPPKVYVADTY